MSKARVKVDQEQLAARALAQVTALSAALTIAPPHGGWSVQSYALGAGLDWSDERGRSHTVLREVIERGELRAHAGLTGNLAARGWDGALADLAAVLPAVTAAIATQLATLTYDRLVIGSRYRVRETLGDLVAGRVVTYAGLDELDNHWGKFDFTGEDGTTLSIGCDPSSPHFSDLADAGRYLEAL